MAKLKYEFENEYYKTHRRPLRDYAFGYFHITAKLASAIVPLSNAVMRCRCSRISQQNFGSHNESPFPNLQSSKSLPQSPRDDKPQDTEENLFF
jgi:hypothetical protein